MCAYQLIVIGAGPGGYTAALRAAKLGLHTAVVERREVGGTCLNRGCIPTKTLLHASQVYHDAVNGAGMGVHGSVTYDIGEMFAFKRSVSEKLRGGIHALLKGAKVDVLTGTAQITAPGQVAVTGEEGTVTYTAERILAATGSVNVRPPIPGLELPGVMTSDELLEGTDTPYRSIVIIGGGVIGVEFATFYSHLGCPVTLVEGILIKEMIPKLENEGVLDAGSSKFSDAVTSGANYSKYWFIQEVLDKEASQSEHRTYMLEGYLFPDTYDFYISSDPDAVATKMLDRFHEIYTEDYKKRAKELGMSTDEVVILASIIEKEAGKTEDFAKVSAVFHNRLNKNMKLQSCATHQYFMTEKKFTYNAEELKIASPYNTYQNKGMPIGPI